VHPHGPLGIGEEDDVGGISTGRVAAAVNPNMASTGMLRSE
jgi:hypothetical protein